jgi:3-oxoacid CoA-transferase B subunit
MRARLDRQTIALRVANEFYDGAIVNLGGGIPALAANFVPEGRSVTFHAENGVLGFGGVPLEDEQSPYNLGANGIPFSVLPGMSFFSHADSFAMIRGGHIDISVLGALQVSEKGDLANWTFPERGIGNIGGAMDLAAGCSRIIVAMEHVTPKGQLKILKECSYPLTAAKCVKHRHGYCSHTGYKRRLGASGNRSRLDGRGSAGVYRAQNAHIPGTKSD